MGPENSVGSLTKQYSVNLRTGSCNISLPGCVKSNVLLSETINNLFGD